MKRDTKIEAWACDALQEHLRKGWSGEATVELLESDPPDLVVTFDNGTTWGVEVVEVHSSAKKIGTGKVVRAEAVYVELERFGKELVGKIEQVTSGGSVLHLEGQGAFASWTDEARKMSFKEWKKATACAILQHVTNEVAMPLSGNGFRWKPADSLSKPLLLIGSGGSVEPDQETGREITRAYQAKAGDLPRWHGTFDQRLILLINQAYFDDDELATECLSELLAKPEGHMFDGAFWIASREAKVIEIGVRLDSAVG